MELISGYREKILIIFISVIDEAYTTTQPTKNHALSQYPVSDAEANGRPIRLYMPLT